MHLQMCHFNGLLICHGVLNCKVASFQNLVLCEHTMRMMEIVFPACNNRPNRFPKNKMIIRKCRPTRLDKFHVHSAGWWMNGRHFGGESFEYVCVCVLCLHELIFWTKASENGNETHLSPRWWRTKWKQLNRTQKRCSSASYGFYFSFSIAHSSSPIHLFIQHFSHR